MAFLKLAEGAIIPQRSTQHAAAYDLAALDYAVIPPMKRAMIQTGIGYQLDDPSHCALVLSRSGLANKKGVFVLNAPGLLDYDYKEGIGVVLFNSGDEDFVVNPGDRIAQFLIITYGTFGDIQNAARTGGFGSTGVERFPQQIDEATRIAEINSIRVPPLTIGDRLDLIGGATVNTHPAIGAVVNFPTTLH